MKQFRYLLLTLMLLGGQFALLAHVTDLHAHVASDECQTCLHASPLDSGLFPATISVAVAPSANHCFPAPRPTETQTIERPFDARGPPSSSSA